MDKKRKIQMNRIYPFIVSIIAIVVMITIYVLQLKFEPLQILEYSGYGVSGSQITENLLNKKFYNENNEKIEAIKIEEQAMLYKKLNKYYIGEDKKLNINTNYPIYINDNVAIYSLAEDCKFITKNFKEEEGYSNITITDGVLYNGSDLTRADMNEYILIKNSDKIFINTKEILIKTVTKEKTINMNSIIYFADEYIAYYEIEEGYFIYNRIDAVDYSNNIKLGEINISYGDFLENLNLRAHKKEIPYKEEKNDLTENNTVKGNEQKTQENILQEEILEEDGQKEKEKKTEIIVGNFETRVYSTSVNIQIIDNTESINKPLTFTFMKGEKTQFRTTVLSSGITEIKGLIPDTEYTVIGIYQYRTQNGDIKQVEVTRQKIKTKSIDSLEEITIGFENGEIFSDKIQIKNIKITSNLSAEAIKGIKKAGIEINGNLYKFSNSDIQKLIVGEKIDFETANIINSNSKIEYEVKFFDSENNEIRLQNNKGETRTYKQKPSVIIVEEEQNIVSVKLRIKLENKDNVEIENYRYEIYNAIKETVGIGSLNQNQTNLELSNLNAEEAFTIKIYGDIDQDDGNGKKENQELGSFNFITVPIKGLGYVNLRTEQMELTKNNIKINMNIDESRTDKRLIQIINKISIVLYKNETDEFVRNIEIEGEELEDFKQFEKLEINLDNLDTFTNYRIDIKGYATQGSKEHEIQTTYSVYDFTTKKEEARLEINGAVFVNGDMIDLEFKIVDKDNAILNNNITYMLKDENGKVVEIDRMQANSDYIRRIYNQLQKDKKYTLHFYAEQYNIGIDDSEYKTNYEFLEPIEFITEEGISGSIDLNSLEKKKKSEGKNLVDVESNVKWYSNCWGVVEFYGKEYDKDDNVLKLYMGNRSTYGQRYLYDLREYIGQEITISFKAKYTGAYQGFYIRNGKDNEQSIFLKGLKTSWTEYTQTLKVGKTGYVGFSIIGMSNNENWLYIKDLQIELGKVKTEYEPYNYQLEANTVINLVDTRNEIEENDYYVKIYKNNNLIKEERYVEIGEDNRVENAYKNYLTEENQQYRIELIVKIKEREYVLDSITFNTANKEIKGIKTKDEFRDIQPKGNYIILNDIDLSGATRNEWYYGSGGNLSFEGTIDFNGKTLTRDATTTSAIFRKIGENAVLKNLVLNVKLNNEIEMQDFMGLFYENNGTIQNIKVNLIESTDKPNLNIRLLGYKNNGTIEKFIIYMQKSMYGANYLYGGVTLNYGIIQDGYVYGDEYTDSKGNIVIEGIKEFYTTTDTNRTAAGVAWNNYGMMQNIYSLLNIQQASQSGVSLRYGNVLGVCTNGVTKNLYSIDNEERIKLTEGPTVGYIQNNGKVDNVYYFSNKIYTNSYNKKTTMLALHDDTFQNTILNNNGAFKFEESYYPHIIMPDVMPVQEYINLPKVSNEDLADILSMEIIEHGIEDIENKQKDYMRVKFNIHNPSGEIISDIKVDNLTSTIESQEYIEGKSVVIVKFNNPTVCVSKYSVREITTKGIYNIPYTRTFEENERPLYIDFYNLIETVADWKQINNSPTENYKLIEDLDFLNQGNSICITKSFFGKIDGGGHTIQNLEFTSKSLFKDFNGAELRNLNIENCNHTKNDTLTGVGIISYLYENSIVDNVHIKDYTINLTNKAIAGNNIGGIVGVAIGSEIKNSSVTNLKLDVKDNEGISYVGGIVGYTYNNLVSIKNCYVQNLYMNFNNCRGGLIGGIIGVSNISNGAVVENCYATGNIYSKYMNVAGIGAHTYCLVKNSYSFINIENYYANVGGITSGNTSSTNNLSLGNLYSKSGITRRFNTSSVASSKNYAYNNQRINGRVIEDTHGAILLNAEELKVPNTYTNTLEWTNFDVSQVQEGILPKLKYTDSDNLLPNQQDNMIPKEESEITLKQLEISEKTEEQVKATLIFSNPYELGIQNIDIDGMNIVITSMNTENGRTRIDIIAKPEKYYDTYEITKIKYLEDNQLKEKEIKAILSAQFYKELKNINDWQAIEKDDTYQNYKLLGDIDFTGISNPNTSIMVARLEGVIKSDGTRPVIKNLDTTINNSHNRAGLIAEARTNITNINFDNINLKSTTSYGYFGIIGHNYGEISNCDFTNITIDAKSKGHVGCIGTQAIAKGNIVLNNITVSGGYTVGSFCGKVTTNTATITATNCKVLGTQYTIGGVIGYSEGGYVFNVIANNIQVEGKQTTGIVLGLGYVAGNITIEDSNCSVKGTNYVGAIVGQLYGSSTNSKIVHNVTVEGTGKGVGGIVGYCDPRWNSYVRNSYIENSRVWGTEEGVGGVVGLSEWSNIYYNAVYNLDIKSISNNVGGILGKQTGNKEQNIYENSVQNSTITGVNNVGGINGTYLRGSIYNNYVNADIKANGNNSGGVLGYLDNTNMTAISNVSSIYKNLVINANITADKKNAGGLIGNIETGIYKDKDFYYNNIVQANITSVETPITASTIIGAVDSSNQHSENNSIKNTYIHNVSKVNGFYINNYKEDNVSRQNIVNALILKTQTTYTSDLGFDKKIWNFDNLKNGKYPTLNNISKDYQLGINIADDPISKMSYRLQNMNVLTQEVEELPDVKVYPISAYELNIEFSKIPKNTVFTIYNSDTEELISKDTIIENRTYTIEYDYKTPITIKVYNVVDEKEIEVNLEDVKSTISIVGEEYSYLEGTNLKTNTRTIEGEFINLYNNYAVTSNKELYNIKTSTIERSIENKITETKPWFEFTYGENTIKTYYSYSEVINGENIAERPQQIIIKNGKMSVIDSSLDKKLQGIIIDNYNEGEYQTILGNDGILYNLKDAIKYPEDFKNQDIIEMTNNIQRNDQKVMLKYENGRIYVFDYLEGKVLYDNYGKVDMSVLEYIKEKWTSEAEIIEDTSDIYEDSKLLAEKLTDTPISIAMSELNLEEQNNTTLENTNNITSISKNEYITAYDSNTKSFVVYSTADILNTNEEEIETQNSKIESSEELKKYYYEGAQSYKSTKQNGIIYVGISLIAVIIILGIFYKRKN